MFGYNMATSQSFFGRLWASQHGNQYAITAVASGATGVLVLLSSYQLLVLQDHADWVDFTGLAIATLVIGGLGFLIAFPEFLRFKGQVNTLEELMQIQSTAELRKRKSEGDEIAAELGAGYAERWNAFLQTRKLKK